MQREMPINMWLMLYLTRYRSLSLMFHEEWVGVSWRERRHRLVLRGLHVCICSAET